MKNRAARRVAHIQIIDFDQPVSDNNSLDRRPPGFHCYTGNEISFLPIACLESYPDLIQTIAINLVVALEVDCPSRKIECYTKILQHIGADPSDDRLRRFLRIPIKETAVNELFAWRRRNRRR